MKYKSKENVRNIIIFKMFIKLNKYSAQIELSIIKQKSLKIDADLEKTEETTREINREIQTNLVKIQCLNEKLSKKRQKHETDENECEVEHSNLLEKLKVFKCYP